MRLAIGCLLLAVGPAVAEPPLVEVPPLDVEANVRRMLEESRARPPADAPSEMAPPDVEQNVRRMLEQGRGAEAEAAAPAAPAVAPRPAAPAPAPAASPNPAPRQDYLDYVPVPEKVITIRSVGDVDAVARELDQARGRNTPPPAGEKPLQ